MISQTRGRSWVYTRGVKIDFGEHAPAECWRGGGRQEWGYFGKFMWLKNPRLHICLVFLLLNWGSKVKNYAGDTMLGGTACEEEDQNIMWMRWITKDWSKINGWNLIAQSSRSCSHSPTRTSAKDCQAIFWKQLKRRKRLGAALWQ